jgi:hypothetical protein
LFANSKGPAYTLVDRVLVEAVGSESVVVGRCEVGAWSRAPADT